MGPIVDSMRAVNSFVRTILLGGLVVLIGAGGYIGYNEYYRADRMLRDQQQRLQQAQQQLDSLQQELAAKAQQIESMAEEIRLRDEKIERLELARSLLKTDQRLARLDVLEVKHDEAGEAQSCIVQFVELAPNGAPISSPKQFEIRGDVVYIDNWIVKFDDEYIERADLERGTSLCLFRRIFGESQTPADGYSLDDVGMRPQAYARGSVMSEFEQRLWSEFWEFANNPKKAAEMGIRAANGEAVSIQVREGMAYNITLRNSGGLSIEPVPHAAPESATDNTSL
ncbi:MAG: hypothetical protein D6753_05290 [Planctomycetota bacterium]|nr:MAG: hypothetical protein D6753_05290 [Planctomycetota bacterium]